MNFIITAQQQIGMTFYLYFVGGQILVALFFLWMFGRNRAYRNLACLSTAFALAMLCYEEYRLIQQLFFHLQYEITPNRLTLWKCGHIVQGMYINEVLHYVGDKLVAKMFTPNEISFLAGNRLHPGD